MPSHMPLHVYSACPLHVVCPRYASKGPVGYDAWSEEATTANMLYRSLTDRDKHALICWMPANYQGCEGDELVPCGATDEL